MINARGGSKGIPKKNIKPFLGKPLIIHSIEVALKSKKIDKVLVSTDCKEIAKLAKDNGAYVPFIRPKKLATSKALQIDTIVYNLKKLENIFKKKVDIVVLLQPTAPLRDIKDVEGCINLIIKKNADTVISITDVGSRHPTGIYKIKNKNELVPFVKINKSGFNRQELEKIYWRTGSVYVIKRHVLINEKAIYGKKVLGYNIPEERSFNLDTLFDWKLAELWAKYSKK